MQLAARDKCPICECVNLALSLLELVWIIEGIVCDVQIDVVKGTLG